MTAEFYYPRAWVEISTSVRGEQVATGIMPSKASVNLRPHNQAGTAEITIHGSALPFDPRMIDGVFVTLYLGAVQSVDAKVQDVSTNARFVGYADQIDDSFDSDGPAVELKMRDMSALFRDFKPIPPLAAPQYSDTLQQAIQRLMDAVPNTKNTDGSPRITLKKTDALNVDLSNAISARLRTAKVQLPRDCTAWQAIEHICGLVSRLVAVDKTEVVVSLPAQSYGHDGPSQADFIFGAETANLISVNRSKKFIRNRKGIRVTSWDLDTRAPIVADFPPDSQLPSAHLPHSRAGHARRTSTGRFATAASTDREPLAGPGGIRGGHSALLAFAERVWTERSHQEIEGKLVTPIWKENVLSLKNADRFTLQIQPDLQMELRNTNDHQAAVRLLVQRLGVDSGAADVLVRASRSRPTDMFYARSITHEFEADGPTASTNVDFINLIEVEPA